MTVFFLCKLKPINKSIFLNKSEFALMNHQTLSLIKKIALLFNYKSLYIMILQINKNMKYNN